MNKCLQYINVIVLLYVVVSCSSRTIDSQNSSVFGKLDGYFPDQHNFSQNLLSMRIGQIEMRFRHEKYKICTGVIVKDGWMVSNSHCLSLATALLPSFPNGEALVEFNSGSLAVDSRNQEISFNYNEEDGWIGTYQGSVSERNEFSYPVDLSESVDLGAKMDIAYFKLIGGKHGLGSINIDREAQSLVMFSFPGALPLFVSNNCKVISQDGDTIKHDCDSFGGSSGGLIINKDTGNPLAIHKSGLSKNVESVEQLTYYKEHGRFPSSSELALSYCQNRPRLPKDCHKNMESRMTNSATMINAFIQEK